VIECLPRSLRESGTARTECILTTRLYWVTCELDRCEAHHHFQRSQCCRPGRPWTCVPSMTFEFSLDFPTQAEQDAQRGLGKLGADSSTGRALCASGCTGDDYRGHDEVKLLAAGGCRTSRETVWRSLACERLSAVRSDLYALTYEEYWQGFLKLFESTDVIAIGEPLVRAMAGLPHTRRRMWRQHVRVTPRATTQALRLLARLRKSPLSELIFVRVRDSELCAFRARFVHFQKRAGLGEFRDSCHGGCAGRRRLQGALPLAGFLCPIIRASAHGSTSAWPHDRDLPKLGPAPAPPS